MRLKHRYIFAFYGILITGLGAYAWYMIRQRHETSLDTAFLTTTASAGLRTVELLNEAYANTIRKAADHYPSTHNDECINQLEQVLSLKDQVRDSLTNLMNFSSCQTFSIANIESIKESVKAFRDSLLVLGRQDPLVNDRINFLLSTSILPVEYITLKADAGLMTLWYDDLLLKIYLAEHTMLSVLRSRLIEADPMPTDWVPVLQFKDSSAIVGKAFNAELGVAGCFPDTNVEYYLNDRYVGQGAGGVHFNYVFKKPGFHKNMVTAKKLTAYGEQVLYIREFEIHAIKP